MSTDVVTIEKVLNSRCSSQFNAGSKKSNWGTFINDGEPKKTINSVLRCCKVLRFSHEKLVHWFRNGYIFLGFEQPDDRSISFFKRISYKSNQ